MKLLKEKYIIRKELCRNCMACFKICPREAIIKKEDKSLEIDQSRCDGCGLCMESCNLRVITKKSGFGFGKRK
ncbi:MAG: 4Fe-4S binding protein [Firmicutes bacterium]|nr:4Fe-4S dicluster domain-containing protein [Clostridiales bacterium]MBQ9932140.1 4Fe-4S binding protein [Bacillota bacterium]